MIARNGPQKLSGPGFLLGHGRLATSDPGIEFVAGFASGPSSHIDVSLWSEMQHRKKSDSIRDNLERGA